MALTLPTLPRGVALVDKDGMPTTQFQVWWQSVTRAVETQEALQDATIVALQTAQLEIIAAQEELAEQLALIIAAQAAADAAEARAVGIQAATSSTFNAADPALKAIFDSLAP